MSVNTGQSTNLLAKIDTGATFCIFQREHAEGLDIDVESGLPEEISTATGRFKAYGHSVNLTCFKYEFETTVYFTEQYDFSRNVLGLRGWFDKFRFGLIHYDATLYLSNYDE